METNPNNTPQTYWQQLTQGGINAALFWTQNIILVTAAYFWWQGEGENAPYVLAIAGTVQAVNMLVTLFQKENVRRRNPNDPAR